MIRKDLLHHIINYFNDSPIIFTTGYTCREAFNIKDSNNHFYMVGSMGMAASIGLGLSTAIKRKVIVVDGDGSLLMNPSNLFMIANEHPNNLIHIVIDNETYDSTGGQETNSKKFDFKDIAKSIGYTKVYKIEDLLSFENILNVINENNGPSLLWVKVSNGISTPGQRISISLPHIYERFKYYIGEGANHDTK